MLKELQPHYLDLLTQAIEATGGHPLLIKQDAYTGTIYVTPNETITKTEYTINFMFGGVGLNDEREGVSLIVGFRDERPKVKFSAAYVDGIDGFFPLFAKALRANRLTGPCGAKVSGFGVEHFNLCTQPSNHDGEHRCNLEDVQARHTE